MDNIPALHKHKRLAKLTDNTPITGGQTCIQHLLTGPSMLHVFDRL